MRIGRACNFALVMLLASSPLAAQDFSSVGDMGVSYGAATVNQSILNSTNNPGLRNSRRGSRSAARIPAGVAAGSFGAFIDGEAVGSGTERFSYATSPALAKQAVDGYIARASRTEPAGARDLAGQLQRHDYRKVYRSLLSGSGLRDDDAADAVAAYTALGWMIANNQLSDPDPRALQGVRRQIAARVAGNSAFAPARRGALGEEMKLLFVTLHAGWQGAQREGNLKTYSKSVTDLFARNNIDLRSLQLTRDGFVGK